MTRRPTAVSWFGRERRSHAALNRLARRLYHVCRNAADPFELAAQLEGLGYNRYQVNREFGFRTTFELAEQLFAITPRRPQLAIPRHSVASPFWWQAALLVALVLSLLFYQVFEVTPNYFMLAWLLTWTLGGGQLMKVFGPANPATQKRTFTLLLGLGLSGVFATVTLPVSNGQVNLQLALFHLTLGLLWWQLPATFWLDTLAPCQRLRHFVVSLLFIFGFFTPPVFSVALLFLAVVLLFAPFLARPRASTLLYLVRNWQFFALPALLGLGQSSLLLQVLPSSPHPFVGLLVIVATVLATAWLESSFKRSVATALWKAKTSEELRSRVFQSLGFFLRLLVVLLFLGLLVLLHLLLPLYSVTLVPFILLALAFSLSFLLSGFKDFFLPATTFSVASLMVFLGFPVTGVVIALTAVLGIGVVLYITKVERYGVDLL
jgi:hypothetical protein